MDAYRLKDRIISQELSNDTLILTIGFRENCCIDFDPAISFQNSELHILLYQEEPESYCLCDCCFELALYIVGIQDTKFKTFIDTSEIVLSDEPYKTYNITYDIIDGDTVNMRNKYRFREGLWLFHNDSTGTLEGKVIYSGKFSENMIWSEWYDFEGRVVERTNIDTSIYYRQNGTIERKKIGEGFRSTVIEYYENGEKKSECAGVTEVEGNITSFWNDCSYWDESGKFIRKEREDWFAK